MSLALIGEFHSLCNTNVRVAFITVSSVRPFNRPWDQSITELAIHQTAWVGITQVTEFNLSGRSVFIGSCHVMACHSVLQTFVGTQCLNGDKQYDLSQYGKKLK